MFDPVSEDLIRRAPPLDNLDLDTLAKALTDAFAHLVALRVRQRGAPGASPDARIAEVLKMLARLARTYEAYVHTLPQSSHRDAAAYVSASAYKVLAVEDEIRGTRRELVMNETIVPSGASAALLFLISGYSSEAAEVVRTAGLNGIEPSSNANAVLRAVGLLATGRLPELASFSTVDPPPKTATSEELALEALWARLLRGLKALAAELLGEPAAGSPETDFRTVFELTGISGLEATETLPTVLGTLPGPHHLAALLLQLPRTLQGRAVSKVPTPGGANSGWESFTRRMARSRPYLWPSHLLAVRSGYLERSVSSVVSFPAGSGKSVVAQLRIGATVARGGRTIYLAPTHALVHQVRSDLDAAFPDTIVADSLIDTGEYSEVESKLPSIAVMTPERCLALLGTDEAAFEGVETIVFDECHLIHPRGDGRDRRALDATLCLLRLTQVATEADVLLMSAMMANPSQLAEWLTKALGRSAQPLEITWKPTRQVRGCLVFPNEEIEALGTLLTEQKPLAEEAKRKRDARARKRGKKPKGRSASVPAAVKKRLVASPHALFSLRSTWATKSTEDYSLLQIREENVPLSAGRFWNLTANRNAVSSALAADFARAGIKTLVFTQARKACESIASEVARELAKHRSAPPELELETQLLGSASAELGGDSFSYADPGRLALSHHGLLLPPERLFNESRFKRDDGISVLCATSTLAQGMNLPAQAVVIAGEERFNAATGRSEILEAHELLNAAGRAGRAGFFSQGLVLVVPAQVVQFDPAEGKIGTRWIKLQEDLFSQSDQCLDIADPIEALLDRAQLGTAAYDDELNYLVDRLPLDDDGQLNLRARDFVGRSLSVFLAKKSEDVYTQQVEALLAFGRARKIPVSDWQLSLATSAGVQVGTIADLSNALAQTGLPGTVADSVDWMLTWMRSDPQKTLALLRLSNLERVLGTCPADASGKSKWVSSGLGTLENLFKLWLRGEPLIELERSLPKKGKSGNLGKLERARAFALGLAADFAYAVGLIAQVARAQEQQGAQPPTRDLSIAASCVREGHATAAGLALHYRLAGTASRVEVHGLLNELHLPADAETADFSKLRRLVAEAAEEASS